MEMEIQIIHATPAHIPEVHRLMKEFAAFQRTPGKFKISEEQMQKDYGLFNCLLAIKAGKIIGVASYFFAYYSWTGKALYLDDLFVVEAYRGAGVGTLLFDAMEQMAEKENCTRLRWQVSNWNQKAIAFYRKRGAVTDEVEINCDLTIEPAGEK
jgi:diamine N-acetyltransferase